MTKLPTLIVTSVIRSTHQGDSHGGVYLVNLESGKIVQPIDWDQVSINWEGRGLDRGLRGIGFHDNEVYIAASNEIFVYDQGLKLKRSLTNRYLKHCHEIFIGGGQLYLTSTGYDSVLEFDLRNGRFARGFHIRSGVEGKLQMRWFDPNADGGPEPGDTIHLNNVFYDAGTLYIAALHLPFLIARDDNGIRQWGQIPPGSHNAQPFQDGIILNDTASNRVLITDVYGTHRSVFPIRIYDETLLLNNDLPQDHARQGFARGLALFGGGDYVAVGSSPSTITLYSIKDGAVLKQVNLTMDVRNSIHGLEIWPFSRPE